MLLPQSSKSLLLSMSVDVSTNDECDNIEEWNPSLFWEEFLGECQSDGRGDPADFHDGHETCSDGRADLMPCSGTGDDGH